MPLQQILPTWLALNNANFLTPSAITDLRTLQDFPAGGLNLGDYFDVTEAEANAASYLPNGLCHWGRYRLVQVDSGATASIVKTGTIGYVRTGTYVQLATVINPGSGGTPGTYNIPANPSSGGGSGAVVQVVVGSSGTIVGASVLQRGFNYVSPPKFDLALAVTGVTGGVVQALLNSTPNIVTSIDVGARPPGTTGGPVAQTRPVVFLNSITPGNYGFIQELGLATVIVALGYGGVAGQFAIPADWTSGTVSLAPTAASGAVIGQTVDWTVVGSAPQLMKIYMTLVPVVQD